MNAAKLAHWLERQIERGARAVTMLALPDRIEVDQVEVDQESDADQIADALLEALADSGHKRGAARASTPGEAAALFRVVVEPGALAVAGAAELVPGGHPEGPAQVVARMLSDGRRHNEAIMTMLLAQAAQASGHYARQLRAAERRAERAERRAADVVRVRERLESRATERAIAVKAAERAEARSDQVSAKLLELAPLALSKFLGLPDGAKAGAFGLVLKNLRGSLTTEQYEGIFRTLTMEQQIQLMHIMQAADGGIDAQAAAGGSSGATTENSGAKVEPVEAADAAKGTAP